MRHGQPRALGEHPRHPRGLRGDLHIEDVASRLSEVGWYALAPASFHRQGSPVLAYDDLDSRMPIVGQLTGEGLAVDVSAAFNHLERSGFAPTQMSNA
jgi:dienelactone hydrolase